MDDKTNRNRVLKLESLGFKWDGKDYNYRNIKVNQIDLFRETDSDFDIRITLINSKLLKT